MTEAYEHGLLGLTRELTKALGWYYKGTTISELNVCNEGERQREIENYAQQTAYFRIGQALLSGQFSLDVQSENYTRDFVRSHLWLLEEAPNICKEASPASFLGRVWCDLFSRTCLAGSNQVNTLPKAKSETRSKQNKDIHKCSSVYSECPFS